MTEDPPPLTEFEAAVLEVVAGLARGEIVTYGEIAAEVGRPGAGRAVGSTLRRHGHTVPWWRVVTANGRLVPGGETRHRAKLVQEGVAVRSGRVVMGTGRRGPASRSSSPGRQDRRSQG